MKNSKQTVTTLSRSNIVNLYPEWSSTTTYETESGVATPTYLSTVRVGNYLYRSMSEDNLNNEPLSNPDLWFKWEVSNIYAMLDFKKATETVWDDDGIVEFEKGNADTLVLGNIKAGTVTVDVLAPKDGVISGLALSENNDVYTMTAGEWYIDNVFDFQEVPWVFPNTEMTVSSDNYIYTKPTNDKHILDGAYDVAIDGTTALIVSGDAKSITAMNITTASAMTFISSTEDDYLNGIGAIALDTVKKIAYVASWDSSAITAFSYLDETNIIKLGEFTSKNMKNPKGISISSSVLYVACYTSNNVVAIDITTPSVMTEISQFSNSNTEYGFEIATDGAELYLFTVIGTIVSIDITTPSAMVELHSLATGSGTAGGIAIDGTVAYVTGRFNTVSIDITTPSAMTVLDTLSVGSFIGTTGIAIDGTVAYIVGTSSGMASIDITTPSAMTDLDIFASGRISGVSGIAIDGTSAYLASKISDTLTSIDITTPSALAELDSYPALVPHIIAQSVGGQQPTTPADKVLAGVIELDGAGALVSITDLRAIITDDTLDLGQTKTFYNDYRGAWLVDLPSIGEIVRVSFLEANEAGTSCGTLLAGKVQEMGDTLDSVNITQIREGRVLKRGASFSTQMDKNLITVTASQADDDTGSDMVFIVEPKTDVHQNILIAGQISSISHDESNADQNSISWNIVGEKVINSIPLGLTEIPYFILGVDPLQITKGSGNAYSERDTATTYRDKDYKTLNEADENEVVNESEGMRGSCEHTNNAPFSEDCSQTEWSKTNLDAPIQDGTLAPDGINQMWLITGDGTVNPHYIRNRVLGIVANDETWNNSIFIKYSDADTVNITAYFTGGSTVVSVIDTFTFSTKTMNSSNFEFEELADGIFRVWCIYTNNASGNTDTQIRVYSNDGTSEASTTSVYVWGAGITDKAFLVPYTPTPTAIAVTTSGDIISYDTASNIPNSTADWSLSWEGTPFFEAGDTNDQYIIRNYTDANNFLKLYVNDDRVMFSIKSDGTQVDSVYPTAVSGTEIAVEIKCISGIVKMYIDDEEVGSDDFSAVLDVPLADTTYVASAGASTPNSNSVIYTKEPHTWKEQ